MTYVGNSARSNNRALIALVIVTVILVAAWAMTGGLDDIPAAEAETVVVTE